MAITQDRKTPKIKVACDYEANPAGYLERPRLHRLLESAMEHPLVIVCAGAGYGKTRAVYSFLSRYEATPIWLQLSDRDNVTTRFFPCACVPTPMCMILTNIIKK